MKTGVQSLALLSGLKIRLAGNCAVGHSHCPHPELLWLWCMFHLTPILGNSICYECGPKKN